jgi:hypothetical protein
MMGTVRYTASSCNVFYILFIYFTYHQLVLKEIHEMRYSMKQYLCR